MGPGHFTIFTYTDLDFWREIMAHRHGHVVLFILSAKCRCSTYGMLTYFGDFGGKCEIISHAGFSKSMIVYVIVSWIHTFPLSMASCVHKFQVLYPANSRKQCTHHWDVSWNCPISPGLKMVRPLLPQNESWKKWLGMGTHSEHQFLMKQKKWGWVRTYSIPIWLGESASNSSYSFGYRLGTMVQDGVDGIEGAWDP